MDRPVNAASAATDNEKTAEPPKRSHPRALNDQQKQRILDALASERFIDRSPAHMVAAMLDEGEYLASERTIYRLLGADHPVRERRQQRRHPAYSPPELLATCVNRVWTWDITKLKGPSSGVWYHLYVVLDLYSRCVVGWSIHERECEDLAKELIRTTCDRQGIAAHQLTIHADRGSAMRSKAVAELLDHLKVRKSHSRPYTSNDNPYSESQFKTMKYSPEFPARFGSIEDARAFCRRFFVWYNSEHRHSGIAMLTPLSVHQGQAEAIIAQRDEVYAEAYRQHPERFVKGQPKAKRLPKAVWINKPADADKEAAMLQQEAKLAAV